MTIAETNNKGFTLIELLVVIAIIGVLAAVVLLAINPNELLKKSRDSQRLSDMTTLRKAIDATIASAGGTTTLPCTTVCDTATPNKDATGGGWIPMNLSAYLSTLPVDPRNTTGVTASDGSAHDFYYYFQSNAAGEYELNTYLESAANNSKVLDTADGGDNAARFETGTNLTLIN